MDDREAERLLRDQERDRNTAARLRAWDRGHRLANARLESEDIPPVPIRFDEHDLPYVDPYGDDTPICGIFQTRQSACDKPAGWGTGHIGTGPCYAHGGNSPKEKVGGALMTAHAIATIMDVDPWEAIEIALRRAAAWSAWYQAKLAEVTDDDALRPGGDAWDWVMGAREMTESMAKYAKMAHDMGVAERKLQVVELQGQMIAKVLMTTLHELGLSQDMEDRARAVMDTQLRMLATRGQADVIPGELSV